MFKDTVIRPIALSAATVVVVACVTPTFEGPKSARPDIPPFVGVMGPTGPAGPQVVLETVVGGENIVIPPPPIANGQT